MRIVLDIPDWAAERHIAIMAGMELVAYKPYSKGWKVKTARCNQCGKCCHMLGPTYPIENADGVCVNLEKVGSDERCALGPYRPWACSWSDPVLIGFPGGEEFCSIRYEDR